MNCKNCDTPLSGRTGKKFCSATCRAQYWEKQNPVLRLDQIQKDQLDWLRENLFDIPCSTSRALEEVLNMFFRYNPALDKKYQTFLKRKSQIQGEANADAKENE